MMTTATGTKRRRTSHEQLYRPKPGSMDPIIALLNKKDLHDQDVLKYLRSDSTACTEPDPDEELFFQRRRELVSLARLVDSGGAQLDGHRRLVPTVRGPPEGPLPPLQQEPPPAGDNGPQLPLPGLLFDQEDEERRWMEREEQEAAETIARVVQHYRSAGVPEDSFRLISVPSRFNQNNVNLTFRRICFAVLAVVTAFICIMLQTLPLFTVPPAVDPRAADKLLPELLHVREFLYHARYCPNLTRHRDSLVDIWKGRASPVDCSDRVLHIPAVSVLQQLARDESAVQSYHRGVNASWAVPACITDEPKHDPKGRQSFHPYHCVRGVHDGWIQNRQVEEALALGARLIQDGYDHFDIHDDLDKIQLLHHELSMIETLEQLLDRVYGINSLHPTAYRVYVALPMDAADVLGEKSSRLLSQTINKTNYLSWLDETKHHNAQVIFTGGGNNWLLPSLKPIRDTCHLLADQDANASYALQTSVFLANGAGADFSGGAMLLADKPVRPRKRIRKGVVVDGWRGRVVVSSGQDLKCRLPTRAGIRAVLQIWWDTRDHEKETCGLMPS